MVQQQPNQPKQLRFSKCPACGSTIRVFEEQGRLLKERKLATPDVNFYYQGGNFLIGNKRIEEKQVIGSKLPIIGVKTDICMDCGLVYAVEVAIGEATKSIVPQKMPPIIGPGGRPLLGG